MYPGQVRWFGWNSTHKLVMSRGDPPGARALARRLQRQDQHDGCCPITNQVKNYPFEVLIRGNPNVSGAILSDQIKNLDWRARKARYKGKVSDDELAETLGKIRALLSMN